MKQGHSWGNLFFNEDEHNRWLVHVNVHGPRFNFSPFTHATHESVPNVRLSERLRIDFSSPYMIYIPHSLGLNRTTTPSQTYQLKYSKSTHLGQAPDKLDAHSSQVSQMVTEKPSLGCQRPG
ncbi:hypothetical protein CC2G_013876 [Coprinopsis cinerea AmutBmut pab1-1]|nr:hypothetical protein CC2G_013876 [Coprinopsis cinerea AmutBmut pab1-1]